MQTFNVYPKKGEPFQIRCERFEVEDNSFILYNDAGKPSPDQSLLSFENIAAIIPEQTQAERMIRFLVYLKRQKEPAEVFAQGFAAEPEITFLLYKTDTIGEILLNHPIQGIYIAKEEVIAIVPADGLISYRR
jgi:hypothetical protein